MNRAEHLQWCKDRANKLIEEGDLTQAFTSMQSDMGKHEGTAEHKALELGTLLLIGGHLNTVKQMLDWVNGFN